MAKFSLEALALVEATEKSMDKAVKDYVKAMDLARKTMALIPSTDGTPKYDSPFADIKLVSIIKLELRRGGILLAQPWFDGSRDIPTMTEGWIEGLGWAFKNAPGEVRSAGPWKKFFESKAST